MLVIISEYGWIISVCFYMLFRIPQAFYNKPILPVLGEKSVSGRNQFLLYLVFFW